jgi:hypothetical protein
MEALEVEMKKHNINLDFSSNSSSHGHAIPSLVSPSMQHLLLRLMSGLLIMEHCIMWLRINLFFYT